MNIDPFLTGVPVSLEAMLDARESRAARQRELLAAGGAVMSFTLNIPGAIKAYPLAEKAFAAGLDAIQERLARCGMAATHWDVRSAVTGSELLAVVDAPATRVKETVMEIEARHPLGRLFDIDVLSPDGQPLRGCDSGRGERTCIVCGGPVWACARSRSHSAEELSRRTAETAYQYFSRQYADQVASAAVRALLYEVGCTPKPGLVDRDNTGSHTDMDIFTFFDSSAALGPYFRDMALAGIGYEGEIGAFLPELRYAGQWAENRMFQATGGVNTHKGAVFSLGLLTAAAGLAWSGKIEDSPEGLLGACGVMAAGTPEELAAARNHDAASHGETAYRRYGVTGARGEAAAGYPSVLGHGLPVMEACLRAGMSLNDAGIAAFLRLVSVAEDSNIISRSDPATLARIQESVRAVVTEQPDAVSLTAYARELDAEFIRENLSPGGCADLLALCYFLVFLRQ